MQKLAIATFALTLIAGPVLAQDATEHEFPMTMTDFMMAYPDASPDDFDMVDADGDGEITEEEFNVARDSGLIGDDA
jgi:hypothetical protein